MTAPIALLPPPKSPYGRTAKELLGYTGKPSTGTGTPGFITGIPDEALPFNTLFGSKTEIRAVPASPVDFMGFQTRWYDNTVYNHVRLELHVVAIGTGAEYIKVMANLTPGNPATWFDAGFGTTEARLDLAVAEPIHSDWIQLDPLAIGDMAWKVMIGGGDGATSVVIGGGSLQFSNRITSPPDRWYWRVGTPSAIPDFYQNATFYGNFWGNLLAPHVRWDVRTFDEIRDNAQILSRTKGTGHATTDCYYTPEGHNDASGWIHRFVGAPLAAQTVNVGAIRHWYVGMSPSATGTGFLQVVTSIYRPGVGVLDSWFSTAKHFRFTPVARYTGNFMRPAFVAQDHDRFVIDLIGNHDLANGFLNTANSHIWICYDGSTEDIPEGTLTTLGSDASYTEFPTLKYLSPIA